jgi:hypothetical protein
MSERFMRRAVKVHQDPFTSSILCFANACCTVGQDKRSKWGTGRMGASQSASRTAVHPQRGVNVRKWHEVDDRGCLLFGPLCGAERTSFAQHEFFRL